MDEKKSAHTGSEHLDSPNDITRAGQADSDDKGEAQRLEDVSDEYKAIEKRVVRKLDMTLVPMLWILYLFNYLDRNNIAQARLNGFEKDLGLKGNQFNIAVSILNVG